MQPSCTTPISICGPLWPMLCCFGPLSTSMRDEHDTYLDCLRNIIYIIATVYTDCHCGCAFVVGVHIFEYMSYLIAIDYR